MRTIAVSLVSFTVAALGIVDTAHAQRGGRGRPDEITNRVGCFFTDATLPPVEGDQQVDLANTDLVHAASTASQLSLLYLYDGADDADQREQFEHTLFGIDEIGIHLRVFQCGRLDLAKAPAAKAKYGKQEPLLVAFGKDGKPVGELSMAGYKASGGALLKLLEKAASPVVKPSLEAFVKDYTAFVRDLEQLINRRKLLQDRKTQAKGEDPSAKAKRATAEKDLKALDGEEQKLLAQEKELVEKNRLPARDAKAHRLGGGKQGGGGGYGGGGNGGGNGGGQQGGGGRAGNGNGNGNGGGNGG
ncbi:MAG TPA: hypothetical protein VK348_08480 [Planctomycetota bacterium]|nr:hypothetical protein [Planctomycetota bacterium]